MSGQLDPDSLAGSVRGDRSGREDRGGSKIFISSQRFLAIFGTVYIVHTERIVHTRPRRVLSLIALFEHL